MTRFVSRCGRVRLAVLVGMVACATSPVRTTPAPDRPTPSPRAGRDFARIESEVLIALNQARSSPATVVGWLEELAGYYNGTRVKRPWWPITLQTSEGPAAVREAIAALRAQPPVTPLVPNAALTSAARDHANDQARSGAIGHTGSDGSTTAARIGRYTEWRVSYSENIDYQPMVRGRDVIESLVVDDGVPGRGHRRNIYEAPARLVGIACGPHPKYDAMCVIVQAGGVSGR